MNVERLLTEPVQIGHRANGASDDYGNPIPGVETWISTWAYVEQSASTENDNARDTTFSDWRVFLIAGTLAGPADRVKREDGTVLELVGVPWQVRSPRTGAITHIEARARTSEG